MRQRPIWVSALFATWFGLSSASGYNLYGRPLDNEASKRLDNFAAEQVANHKLSVGYPINQNTDMREFYEWYLKSRLYEVSLNNVGNPQKDSPIRANTHEFENEVIAFFAPAFGFNANESWG